MSSELGQSNEDNDQITVHKPGNASIKEKTYTKEEIQARRKDRMVKNNSNIKIKINFEIKCLEK
jgi:hypothetical protein